MDTKEIAKLFARELITHQGKLASEAHEAQVAQAALESAAKAMVDQHDAQRKASETLLGRWHGHAAAGFESKSVKFGKDLTTTAEASARGAKIVAEVTEALVGRRTAAERLVDEFVTKAARILEAGLAVAGVAVPAG